MRKSCSCGNAWADEPGHDYDQEDSAEEYEEYDHSRAKEDARNAWQHKEARGGR